MLSHTILASVFLLVTAQGETNGSCLLSRRSTLQRSVQGEDVPLCTNSCSEGCFAIPFNSQSATDDDCAPCADGQAWWPCGVKNLCSCGKVVPKTCTKSSKAPWWASWTDEQCGKCWLDMNANRWPCSQADACTCSDGDDDQPTAQPTAEPTAELTTAEPTTAEPTAGPTTAEPTTAEPTAEPTTAEPAPTPPGDALQLGNWEVPTSATGKTCTLNTHNGGYDLEVVNHCMHDKFSDIVAPGDDNWVSIASWRKYGLAQPLTQTIPDDVSVAGTDVSRRDVNVARLSVIEGGVEKEIKAAVGFGHGVADLKCGDCFILKTSGTRLHPSDSWIFSNDNFVDLIEYDKETRYAVIRTVDIATWSLEVSDPALYYMIPLDGRIDHTTTPDYQPVDCAAVMGATVV